MRDYQKSPELKKQYPEPKAYIEYLVNEEYEKFKEARRHQDPIEEDAYPDYLKPRHASSAPEPEAHPKEAFWEQNEEDKFFQ